jgi:lysozyme
MDIKAIRKAKKLIKHFEGLRLKPYYCSASVKTIGWGHVILSSDSIIGEITIERAEELLEQDIAKANSCLCRNLRALELNSNQRAALISFIFNLGSGNFQSSTLRQKLLRGEYEEVALEFERFVYAGGRKLEGLKRRRIAERELFETPEIERRVVQSEIGIFAKLRYFLFDHRRTYVKVKI